MKRVALLGLMAGMIGFSTFAHADFVFYSNQSNACEFVPGKWSGSGKATTWVTGECVYHGTGWTSTLDSTGHFKMEVTAHKDSGNFLCPKHTTKKLTGVCNNGVVSITTEYGDLGGSFSSTSGEARGKLSVGAGVTAEVEIHFQRVS